MVVVVVAEVESSGSSSSSSSSSSSRGKIIYFAHDTSIWPTQFTLPMCSFWVPDVIWSHVLQLLELNCSISYHTSFLDILIVLPVGLHYFNSVKEFCCMDWLHNIFISITNAKFYSISIVTWLLIPSHFHFPFHYIYKTIARHILSKLLHYINSY
jgi:hypothetical protein